MTDTPEHPEDQAREQDQSLEAQLDALLSDLEAVDPQSVPSDLRKHKDKPEFKPAPPKPVAAKAQAPELEPEPEPITAGDAGQDQTPTQASLDLETIASMASNLLDQQIEATIESASSPADSKKPDAETAVGNAVTGPDKPTEQANQPKISKPLSEDELGDQIQAMLNDVQAHQTQPRVGSTGESATESESQPAPATAARQTEDEALSEAGAVSIQQIDAMLAESAEQAIEAGPDPSERVPGTDEILAAQQQAEAEAAEAQAAAEARTQVSANEAKATAEPVSQPAETESEPHPAQSFTADADDVAKELDEAPPSKIAPSPAPAAVEAQSPQDDPAFEHDAAREPAEMIAHQANLKKAELALLHLCGTINRPLNRLSPEMRDMVGWVGVVTVGLGFFVFVYGVLF